MVSQMILSPSSVVGGDCSELRLPAPKPPFRALNWREIPVREQVRFTVLFEPADEGGYVVTCPALPGLVTEGDTLEEARAMAADAIRVYLDSLREDGEPIPDKKLPADPVK